jgi:hypothetical protein
MSTRTHPTHAHPPLICHRLPDPRPPPPHPLHPSQLSTGWAADRAARDDAQLEWQAATLRVRDAAVAELEVSHAASQARLTAEFASAARARDTDMAAAELEHSAARSQLAAQLVAYVARCLVRSALLRALHLWRLNALRTHIGEAVSSVERAAAEVISDARRAANDARQAEDGAHTRARETAVVAQAAMQVAAVSQLRRVLYRAVVGRQLRRGMAALHDAVVDGRRREQLARWHATALAASTVRAILYRLLVLRPLRRGMRALQLALADGRSARLVGGWRATAFAVTFAAGAARWRWLRMRRGFRCWRRNAWAVRWAAREGAARVAAVVARRVRVRAARSFTLWRAHAVVARQAALLLAHVREASRLKRLRYLGTLTRLGAMHAARFTLLRHLQAWRCVRHERLLAELEAQIEGNRAKFERLQARLQGRKPAKGKKQPRQQHHNHLQLPSPSYGGSGGEDDDGDDLVPETGPHAAAAAAAAVALDARGRSASRLHGSHLHGHSKHCKICRRRCLKHNQPPDPAELTFGL